MEPSRFRRTQTLQQFAICPEPDLVFNDYLENLSSSCNHAIFFHFVEKFKGIKSVVPADRHLAGYQLLKVLADYFQNATHHITSIGLKPGEYRSSLIELLQTFIIVSGDHVTDKKAILEVIHPMVMAFPTHHDALFNALGPQLNVDRFWHQEGFEFLYKRYMETSLPREAHIEELSCYLDSFSYLFWPDREEFIVKYIAYHLLKDKETVSECLDYLLIVAFRSKLPRKRGPVNPELAKAFILIFSSSQFINLNMDSALFHLQNSHIFFDFPKEVIYALYEGLLDNANKEQIVRLEVTQDHTTGIKNYKSQRIPHFVSTRQLQELFEFFVNPQLKWDKETFRQVKKNDLAKLFQRNIRVEPEVFCWRAASASTLFFQTLVPQTKEFCEAFALDTKRSIDHINCELFAGTCSQLQRAVLRSGPLPNICDPRDLLLKRIKESLANHKIIATIGLLFKEIQGIDPEVHARHKDRLAQKIRLLDQKTVLMGSFVYLLHFNTTGMSVQKKELAKP